MAKQKVRIRSLKQREFRNFHVHMKNLENTTDDLDNLYSDLENDLR